MPPSAPSWPDPAVIAQTANGFFRASPNRPVPTSESAGAPIAPPSPTLMPAASVATTVAPYAPAPPPFGTPDVPTTIASVVPTPNTSAPATPSPGQYAVSGLPDVPQPGASPGAFAPPYPVAVDLKTPPMQLGDIMAFVPPQHANTPFGAAGAPRAPDESLYFLDPMLRTPGVVIAPPATSEFAAFAPAAPPAAPFDTQPETRPSIGVTTAPYLPGPSVAPAQPSAPAMRAIGSPASLGAVPPAPVGDGGLAPTTALTGEVPSYPEAQIPGEALYFLSERQALRPGAGALPEQGATADLAPLSLDLRPEVVADLGSATRPFDPYTIKRDFPILREQVNGRPLIWLDNAATTQKPQAVIDRLVYFYEHENSNIHRGAHALAARATDAFEAARQKVTRFLNAGSDRDIVFVRGATEGINLVAQAWGRRNVKEGDEIVITWLEHHANIVPWQQLCSEVGARLRVAPVDDTGQVILEQYERLLGPRTRIVAFPQVSNALGTILPVGEMTAMAHRHGACVLVDGAQSVSHMPVDVQAIDCDFFVFSGHKIFGPTGIGVVCGKPNVLAHMPPWQGGGNMIADVTFEKTIYQPPPGRFEAGTGNIADAAGLGTALDYVESIGREIIERYEHELLVYATERMLTVPGLTLIGTAREKASVLSFVLDGCRSEDVGKALNREGIAVRAGHHCAQPILRRFGLESTVRPSLAFYNTREDVDALVAALYRIQSGRSYAAGT
jgi:cysteine desulfurase / selenocysteine lyase